MVLLEKPLSAVAAQPRFCLSGSPGNLVSSLILFNNSTHSFSVSAGQGGSCCLQTQTLTDTRNPRVYILNRPLSGTSFMASTVRKKKKWGSSYKEGRKEGRKGRSSENKCTVGVGNMELFIAWKRITFLQYALDSVDTSHRFSGHLHKLGFQWQQTFTEALQGHPPSEWDSGYNSFVRYTCLAKHFFLACALLIHFLNVSLVE